MLNAMAQALHQLDGAIDDAAGVVALDGKALLVAADGVALGRTAALHAQRDAPTAVVQGFQLLLQVFRSIALAVGSLLVGDYLDALGLHGHAGYREQEGNEYLFHDEWGYCGAI